MRELIGVFHAKSAKGFRKGRRGNRYNSPRSLRKNVASSARTSFVSRKERRGVSQRKQGLNFYISLREKAGL